MSGNTGSSGVRNLRAMFENKGTDQSTSPPSRGRSPSGSVNSGNSRPVSKVRASFVAVERPRDISAGQQWGLRKASDVSSMAEVKENETGNDVTRTSTVVTQNPEPIKSPTSPHTSQDSMDGGLGSILKGSSFEGTPKKQIQKDNTSPTKDSSPLSQKKEPTATNGVGSKAAEVIKKMQSNEKPGPLPSTSLITKPDAKPIKNPHPKPLVKPSPKPPRSPKVDKPSPKTPTSPVTARSLVRGGPAKIKGVMESAKRATEAREAVKKEPPKPMSKKEPGSKPVSREVETQPKPKVNGVKKEAVNSPTKSTTTPKSPTRPSKLPSAATATTATTAAKRDSQAPAQQPAKKSAPRASLPASQSRATGATAASALHKKSSRASLAPNGHDRPKSRVSLNKPDDGFLARMMRPTQSSQQKTHEKALVESPPRAHKITGSHPKPRTSSFKGARKSDQSDSQHSKLDGVTEAPPDENAATPGAEGTAAPSRQAEALATGPNGVSTANT